MRTLTSLLAAAVIAAFGLAGTAQAAHDGVTVIQIDIKPFSDPNSINTKKKSGSKSVVPVAICDGGPVVNDVTIDDASIPTGFSGATTYIDLSTIEFAVDVSGVMLGGTVASPKHDLTDPLVLGDHMTQFVGGVLSELDAPNCSGNADVPDLVVHFPIVDTGLSPADDGQSVCLQADLNDGTHLRGCDFVKIKQ